MGSASLRSRFNAPIWKEASKWKHLSRREMFVGFSPAHSSDVPLILNLHTVQISPQYHVVFDDNFSTVPSIASDTDHPHMLEYS